MKSFLITIFILFFFLFCCDRVGGYIMKIMYFHSNSTVDVKIRESINMKDNTLIFLGSSRCHHHYDISIIEDSLSIQTYNAGVRGGSNIYFNYALFELILESYTPQFIVYDLILGDFIKDNNSYDKLIPLSPYYGMSRKVDSLFVEGQMGWKYDLSHLYRYNGKVFTTFAGIIMEPDPLVYKGFQPKFGTIAIDKKIKYKRLAQKSTPLYEVDKNKIRYLQKLKHFCNEKGIMLIFAVSPTFHYCPPNEYGEIKKFAKKNDIKLLDYTNNNIFVGKNNLFYDEMHLNDEGAHIYSSMIAHDLKNIITR